MSKSKSLYNADLAPTPSNKKNWDGSKSLMYGQTMYKVYLDILWQRLYF